MECWWVHPSSHDQSAQAFTDDVHSWRRRLCWVYWRDADVKTQLDEIIRNKAICQKVANAVAERGYSCMREQC